MTEDARIARALDYATEKHAGQIRMGGLPYISHPVAVSEMMRERGYDAEYQLTALFHDLLEDTDATEEEIARLGGQRVLAAVKLLTKEKGYVMAEYVAGIKSDPMAYAVKGADRLHNLRCAMSADQDFRRRYILETVDWYLGFCPEIPAALKELVDSLERPLAELPFLYEPVDTWRLV